MPLDALAQPPLIAAPDDPKAWPAWRQGLSAWRDETRAAFRYEGSTYAQPEFAWMQHCFAFAKVMIFDRQFMDPNRGEFLVDSWLDWMERDFGGIDALILWQAYPRIGVDRRNQFDHYRQVPGGIKNLRRLIDRMHERGVKAGLAYNPWDTGTHRESVTDSLAMAELVGEAGFDSIFLDTLPQGGGDLRQAMDRARKGVVLESELAMTLEAIPTHHASWAQWFNDSHAPGVLRNKWFEQRHMQHMIRRWDLDHSGEMQMAWMNGAGMFLWQNIFGSWNGWNDRDRTILRAMLPIQRRYATHFSQGLWSPLVATSDPNLFASKWEKDGLSLWTAVNRDSNPIGGFIESTSNDGSTKLFDLVKGVEVDHGHLEIPACGIGALLAIPSSKVDAGFNKFLAQQAERHAKATYIERRIDPMPVRIAFDKAHASALPQGMKEIRAGNHKVESVFRIRECGEYGYGIFMYQAFPGLHQDRPVERQVRIGRVAVAETEVTNADYHHFLTESHYKPSSTESFLLHWEGNSPKAGTEQDPVIYVSLDDARAYAKWAGLRLPTEDEWQLAVQEHRLPYGKVWNWTESEHEDGRTTFSIIKGGYPWESKGSGWYFDSGLRDPSWSAKYIHFWPGMDRSETIGFRCACDL